MIHRPLSHLKVPALLAAASVANAGGASLQVIAPGYFITDLSRDGTIAVGNTAGDFETFRWTAQSGFQRLGRATVPVIGRGAGTPDVSYDGTRVSASILSSDTKVTQGLWMGNAGWIEAMPPVPSDGANIDESWGSAWALSGDGTTVFGFYWGGTPVRAKASSWKGSGVPLALGQIVGRSARVNGADFDGSVAVGWEERADGVWRPTCWREGNKITLEDSLAFAGAEAANVDGSVIVGNTYNPAIATVVATVWRWNGSAYITDMIGTLPDTPQVFGSAYLSSVSDDGLTAVGASRFSNQFSDATWAMIWTQSGGLVRGEEYLTSLGLTLPPDTALISFNSISADARAITGIIVQTVLPFESQSIIIRTAPPCVGDLSGDLVVNTQDLTMFLGAFGSTQPFGSNGDLNSDGAVNTLDLTIFLAQFGANCK